MQLLLEMTKPVDEMFFISFAVLAPEGAICAVDGEICVRRFHLYFDCMENAMQL